MSRLARTFAALALLSLAVPVAQGCSSSAASAGDTGTPTVHRACVDVGAPCGASGDCCSDICLPSGTCAEPWGQCHAQKEACARNDDCCTNHCSSGQCAPSVCASPGAACTRDGECCDGKCDTGGGTCVAPVGCAAFGVACKQAAECCSGACGLDGRCGAHSCDLHGRRCANTKDCCDSACVGGTCTPYIQVFEACGGTIPCQPGLTCDPTAKICTKPCAGMLKADLSGFDLDAIQVSKDAGALADCACTGACQAVCYDTVAPSFCSGAAPVPHGQCQTCLETSCAAELAACR